MIGYSAPRYLFRRHAILKRLTPSNSFLEIGSGNLKLSAEMMRKFDKGMVVDFEDDVKKYYDQLPKKISSKLKISIGNILTMKIREKFDCVVACEVMEHIKDDERFLKKVNSLVKKGGKVVISVPAKKKYWTVHDEAVGHFRRYEKKDLEKMFKKQGFRNINVVSYGFPFINLLWLLRAVHGRMQMKKKKSWSAEKRTKNSGINQVPKSFVILGLIANKYVFYIPNIISSLFDNMSLSEGYIVIADK